MLQTGGRHLGRHTKGALQVQQVDGGFQDTDADRLAQGSMARPKQSTTTGPSYRAVAIAYGPVTANCSIICAGV